MNIAGVPCSSCASAAQTSVAMVKKTLDALKIEGRAAVGLIDAAGAVAGNGGGDGARPRPADGTGQAVDVTV